MNVHPDHRTRAEDALAHAQRNPVMSAEQSFLSAQVHALLALERRLEEVVVALRDALSPQTPVETRFVEKQNGAAKHRPLEKVNAPHAEMQDQLDRAADDGWPDTSIRDGIRDIAVPSKVAP
jgi:hypothetical protein